MTVNRVLRTSGLSALLLAAAVGCADDDSALPPDAKNPDAGALATLQEGKCQIDGDTPDYLTHIDCQKDFEALASEPLDDSIPGARSGKVVLDRQDGDALYFQNSNKYQIHYQFASAHLSGEGKPIVTSLSDFNDTEYFTPDRRFLLGAITYYSGPKVWALELAPYDTSSAEMIEKLLRAVRGKTFFGSVLVFHPTSEAVASEAAKLPKDIKVLSTADLYQGIDYQPLNLGECIGQLKILRASELATSYFGFRDIIVLDAVPNDIAVVAGMITEQFQTPLSHVNVLAQNRKTPNMGLKDGSKKLQAMNGKWVKLTVGAFDWSVVEVTQDEADAFWETHKPATVKLPELDLSVKDLRDIQDVTEQATGKKVTRAAIGTALRAFGAKAANYSVLVHTKGVPIKPGFAIPAFYYVQFMQENGFSDRVRGLLADSNFKNDATMRDAALKQLRDDIKSAELNADFVELLRKKTEAEYPGQTLRFRSSTNAEDLDGFPCAGCYDSHTGDPADWEGDFLYAIKQTWATTWSFRTFEERDYHSIDHLAVGMALLVHTNFPDEEANGVAVTANPYDPTGLSPGFYVNVQQGGEAEVVAPPEGVTSDTFIYQFSFPGTPVIYLTHSSLVDPGSTVLTDRQIYQLGSALDAIHDAFGDAYGPGAGNNGWYAMDVEFKFDNDADPSQAASLYIKQARPYPGRGQ
jgi:pyruvate,water dikinase